MGHSYSFPGQPSRMYANVLINYSSVIPNEPSGHRGETALKLECATDEQRGFRQPVATAAGCALQVICAPAQVARSSAGAPRVRLFAARARREWRWALLWRAFKALARRCCSRAN
jgi:hypothetical protein